MEFIQAGLFWGCARAAAPPHPEYAEARVFDRGVERGRQRQAQHAARVGRGDDAVVPQARGGVVRMAFALVLLADGRLERVFLGRRPVAAARLDAVALDGGQHAGGLLAAHDRDARVGPHEQHARRIGAAAHAVVAGAERAADQHGELGHGGGGHGRHHLGAVTRDAFVLVLAADHEAGDVLQEHQRDLALRAQLDEVRALLRRLREEDAVVGHDAHRHALDVGKARDQRGAEAGLELVEFRAVDDARDDLAHVIGLAGVGRDDAVQFGRVVARFAHGPQRQRLRLCRFSRATALRASCSACMSLAAR